MRQRPKGRFQLASAHRASSPCGVNVHPHVYEGRSVEDVTLRAVAVRLSHPVDASLLRSKESRCPTAGMLRNILLPERRSSLDRP